MTNNVNNRTLGLGFGPGYEFNLFLKEETYKPFINPIDKIEELRKAILTNQIDRPDIFKHIPDVLVNLDIDRLAALLSKIIGELDEEFKQLFSDEKTLGQIDRQFLNTVALAIAEEKRPQTAQDWVRFLSVEKLHQVDPYLLAYLIPVILDHMDDSHLALAASQIAKRLDQRHFKAITVPNYFDIQFTNQPQKLLLKNNGRALVFKAEEGNKSTAIFRNKVWELDHTHIHLEADGEEREYRFYETRDQYEKTKNTSADPNLEIIGEIHSVYKRVSKKSGKLKYMAIGIPLKRGEKNADFQAILDHAKAQRIGNEISDGIAIPTPILFHDIFMRKFSSQDVIYHSWGSLKSDTFAFRDSGLRFNIVNKPISISQEQYQFLKVLFGELQQLDSNKLLYPIDRKANHRKIR